MIEELIPGKAEILPVHILSQEERCILHQAISSSILLFDNENKYKLYGQIPQTEKLKGNYLKKTDIYSN